MKKLFISCPMKNRSKENIRMTFDRLHKIAEAVFGESLEVIPTYIEDNPPKCKTEGLWYPITQYKKESNEIEVVTNVFTPLSEENPRFHIQLSANYDTEKAEWNQFLEDNQWKLYPLLRNILNVFLPPHEPGYRILYTLYPEGFLSVIAEPLKSEEA